MKNYFGVDRYIGKKFEDSLNLHIQYVKMAGSMQQVDVPKDILGSHDESKWTEDEFPAYANWFFGDKSDPYGFAMAWNHHIHHNPHHWQHWIFPDRFSLPGANIECGVLPMPEKYAREMVADWMGASMAYTRSWNMNDWFIKNVSSIILHTETADFVKYLLAGLGYEQVYHFRFARADQ